MVSYSLQLSVVQDTNPCVCRECSIELMASTRKIEVSIPIHIFNLASLPSDLWLEHETFLSETRHKASQRRYYGEKAQRRWSTPVELLSGFVSKHRPLPTPTPVIPGLPRRLSSAQLASPPRMSLPPSPLNNSQPEWIIHRLPAVVEETETKAVRTSRHLRETSGNRGRSVSPPPAPLPVSPPRLRRPPSVVGPRPAPPRSTSYPLPVEPVDSSPQSPTRLSTPPLLSPVPLNMEPNSYFDQQVHSLSPETPLDLGKLSPGTVMSLESLAEQLELNTPGMDKSLPLSPDESRSRAMNVPLSSSPLRERPSIFSVFSDASRPEATRRESSERRVAVETRHLREASHAAEVFEEVRHTLEHLLMTRAQSFRSKVRTPARRHLSYRNPQVARAFCSMLRRQSRPRDQQEVDAVVKSQQSKISSLRSNDNLRCLLLWWTSESGVNLCPTSLPFLVSKMFQHRTSGTRSLSFRLLRHRSSRP